MNSAMASSDAKPLNEYHLLPFQQWHPNQKFSHSNPKWSNIHQKKKNFSMFVSVPIPDEIGS
jgi:hypothetical protein